MWYPWDVRIVLFLWRVRTCKAARLWNSQGGTNLLVELMVYKLLYPPRLRTPSPCPWEISATGSCPRSRTRVCPPPLRIENSLARREIA